jgi:hypothetical protein
VSLHPRADGHAISSQKLFHFLKEKIYEDYSSNSLGSIDRAWFRGSGKGGKRIMLRFRRLLRFLLRVLELT